MTATEQRAHKRAWTIDRVAYGLLIFLSVAQMTRIEKAIDLGQANHTSMSVIESWAKTAGTLIGWPFNP